MIYDNIEQELKTLKIDFTSEEIAQWATDNNITEQSLIAIFSLTKAMHCKKDNTIVETLLKFSKIPRKAPKTFDNFDLARYEEDNRLVINSFKTLSFLKVKRNLIFIGDTGTGKTHLAQAIGHECCLNGIKTYYIKFQELNDKITEALKFGRTKRLLDGLLKPSCLIIDEIGFTKFNETNTNLFFQLIDRRSEKEEGNIIVTSNYNPSLWREFFTGDAALGNAIDRLLNVSSCIKFEGQSYRGADRELYQFKTLAPILIQK